MQKLFRQYAFLFFYERTLGGLIDLPELYSIAVIPLACVPLDRKGYNIFMTDIWEQFVFLPVSAAAAAVSSFLLVYIREYFVYKVACFDTGCPGFQGILIKNRTLPSPAFQCRYIVFCCYTDSSNSSSAISSVLSLSASSTVHPQWSASAFFRKRKKSS